MLDWLQILAGLLLLVFGLMYLYFPQLILRVNALIRQYICNDTIALLYRRKSGIILFLLALIFLFNGIYSLYHKQRIPLPGMNMHETKLYQLQELIYLQNYPAAVKLGEALLNELGPENIRVLTRLGLAYYLSGEKRKGRSLWQKALRIEPTNYELKSLMENFPFENK